MKQYLLVVLLFGFISASAQPVYDRFIGGDLSTLGHLEHLGTQFNDYYANQVDCLEHLNSHGITGVRLRLWHTPSEPWNGLDSTLVQAVRIKENGMKFMLDFHYSDWWADPGQQNIPSAWQNLDLNTTCDSIYNYTNAVIRELRDLDALPDYVQVGNEITNGMLWPLARVNGIYDTPEQWQNFSLLYNSGVAGVLDSLAVNQYPWIVLHHAGGGDNESSRWFYDRSEEYGLIYDVIGLSYYPWWHGTIYNLRVNLFDLVDRYGKPIQIVETSYPFTLGWNDNTNNIAGSEQHLHVGYDATTEGQAEFYADVFQAVIDLPDNLGQALWLWEPAWVSNDQLGSPIENMAIFDFDNNATTTLYSFNQLLDVEEKTSNTAESHELEVVLAPNPFNDFTYITINRTHLSSFKIYLVNILGQSVFHQDYQLSRGTMNRLLLNTSNLPSGIYICSITNAGKILATRKIVKIN